MSRSHVGICREIISALARARSRLPPPRPPSNWTALTRHNLVQWRVLFRRPLSFSLSCLSVLFWEIAPRESRNLFYFLLLPELAPTLHSQNAHPSPACRLPTPPWRLSLSAREPGRSGRRVRRAGSRPLDRRQKRIRTPLWLSPKLAARLRLTSTTHRTEGAYKAFNSLSLLFSSSPGQHEQHTRTYFPSSSPLFFSLLSLALTRSQSSWALQSRRSQSGS